MLSSMGTTGQRHKNWLEKIEHWTVPTLVVEPLQGKCFPYLHNIQSMPMNYYVNIQITINCVVIRRQRSWQGKWRSSSAYLSYLEGKHLELLSTWLLVPPPPPLLLLMLLELWTLTELALSWDCRYPFGLGATSGGVTALLVGGATVMEGGAILSPRRYFLTLSEVKRRLVEPDMEEEEAFSFESHTVNEMKQRTLVKSCRYF